MKVLVLSGGNSPEREVSLRSGENIRSALRDSGHKVYDYDPAGGYGGLDEYVGKVDVVFPILHGAGGEDGEIQEELEARQFNYLGSGPRASADCFNKVKTKEILNKLSILTPKYEIVTADSFAGSALTKKPYVLKPIEGGSTIDAFIVRAPDSAQIDVDILKRYKSMLLEELVDGKEITVPVLGNKSLPVIEIIPPAGREFDYENKYNGESQELCPPKNVDEGIQRRAQQLALQAHRALGARHLTRSDFIVDSGGQIWALEINTMPGMTAESLYPKSALAAGINIAQLVDRFTEMSLQPTKSTSL
ncbi:MAG TPA: D-alanine--D-alanine ligase [Candidatus Saccharimonadales bacterium]|nr:D-alanine--D-alanine ligase [Candidatus Saccharimonadales bacterium]